MFDQSQLQRALAQWQLWQIDPLCPAVSPPNVVGTLSGGKTNKIYLLELSGRLLVLRLHSLHSEKLGINRQREKLIHCAAADLGIAPTYYYLAEDNSYSVLAYIEGTRWRAAWLQDTGRLRRLWANVGLVHHIDLSIPPFDYTAHINRYREQLLQWDELTDELNESCNEAIKWLSTNKGNFRQGITHHDLNVLNILENSRGVFILDWEYAGYGYVDLDIARVQTDYKPAQFGQINGLLDTMWQILQQHNLSGY